MGNQKLYNSTNRFSSYLFEDSTAWAVHEINGIIGRVMEMNADPAGQHAGLPIFPDSSDMYFSTDENRAVMQAIINVGNRRMLIFDWGHMHINPDGKVFPKGVVHVHVCTIDEDGHLVLSAHARLMTEAEISKYGPLLKSYDPKVRFRP